jgi:hypothetical protein
VINFLKFIRGGGKKKQIKQKKKECNTIIQIKGTKYNNTIIIGRK